MIASPTSQRVNRTSPLRMTCIAYLGSETLQQPTSLTWYTETNEIVRNSTQVNIYSKLIVRHGLVFMESILEACNVYSDLIGQLSCRVSNVGGEDNARWNITYDVLPPVIVIDKPRSQVVNYTSTLQMNCTALVIRETASDSNITWWVESNQVYNSSEATIYTRRVRNGNMLYVQSTLTISSVSYLHLGEFSCRAENSLGRDAVMWTITTPVEYPAPNVTMTPTTTLVSFGDTVSATCTANVGPQRAYNIDPSTIVWQDIYRKPIRPEMNQVYTNNSMTIVDDNIILESTLFISSIDFQHVGYLACQVDNAFGTDYATIYVDTYETLAAPRLLFSPVNQTVDCIGRVSMVCIVNAFPTPDIWWTYNDVYIDAIASNKFNIIESRVSRYGLNFSESYFDICAVEEVGNYKCIVSNALGNVTSRPGKISRADIIRNNIIKHPFLQRLWTLTLILLLL